MARKPGGGGKRTRFTIEGSQPSAVTIWFPEHPTLVEAATRKGLGKPAKVRDTHDIRRALEQAAAAGKLPWERASGKEKLRRIKSLLQIIATEGRADRVTINDVEERNLQSIQQKLDSHMLPRITEDEIQTLNDLHSRLRLLNVKVPNITFRTRR